MTKKEAKQQAYRIASQLLDAAVQGDNLSDTNLTDEEERLVIVELNKISQSLFNKSGPRRSEHR